MKKIILIFLLSFFIAGAYAQSSSDSLAYQVQRKKVNSMLAVRKQKFGEYDQSLNKHTGIFGIQTKKDIRNSNDILMDIVKTDDQIFVQLKVLLDYTMFQQKQVQSHAVAADSSSVNYITTINKLQASNDKLTQLLAAEYVQEQRKSQIATGIIIALIVGVLLLLRAKYVKKDR